MLVMRLDCSLRPLQLQVGMFDLMLTQFAWALSVAFAGCNFRWSGKVFLIATYI
jgi:hypothetical protein